MEGSIVPHREGPSRWLFLTAAVAIVVVLLATLPNPAQMQNDRVADSLKYGERTVYSYTASDVARTVTFCPDPYNLDIFRFSKGDVDCPISRQELGRLPFLRKVQVHTDYLSGELQYFLNGFFGW